MQSNCVVQTGGGGSEVPHLPGTQHGEVPQGGLPGQPAECHQVPADQVGGEGDTLTLPSFYRPPTVLGKNK